MLVALHLFAIIDVSRHACEASFTCHNIASNLYPQHSHSGVPYEVQRPVQNFLSPIQKYAISVPFSKPTPPGVGAPHPIFKPQQIFKIDQILTTYTFYQNIGVGSK